MIFALLPVPCLVVDLELGLFIRRSILLLFHITCTHYASIEVTGKDHSIIILSRISIDYLFYPHSRVDIMAGFHPHDDPYFPNEGNARWLEEVPEDDHPICRTWFLVCISFWVFCIFGLGLGELKD